MSANSQELNYTSVLEVRNSACLRGGGAVDHGRHSKNKAPISQGLNRNSVSNRDAAGQLDYLTLIVMGLPSSPTWKTTILVASFALRFLARIVCPSSTR